MQYILPWIIFCADSLKRSCDPAHAFFNYLDPALLILPVLGIRFKMSPFIAEDKLKSLNI